MDEMYLFKSQDEGKHLLYAYYKGEFWFYDPNVQQWCISGHVREQYELEAQKDVSLTPDDFTCTGYGYEFVAEYEVPVSVLDALRAAKKVLPPEPVSAEAPETADEGSEPEDGFPGWVHPMVEAFLQFPFFRELPAFTAFAIRHSEPVQHHQGGSLADGVYDTGPKGIKFFVFRGDNSDQYREVSYTWAGFVRRCKAAGLVPEPPRQDKEDAPCKTETPAPTGAAAATTDGSAAVSTAETTTTSESGADASTPLSESSSTQGPNSSPAPASRADAGAAEHEQSLSAAGPASLEAKDMNVPTFDYHGLDDKTVAVLHLAESEIREARQIYICRVSSAVAAAHNAVVANCENGESGKFSSHEKTFLSWCASVGLKKDAAYRFLQVNHLLTGSTPEEQATLEAASPSLLYAAAKPSAPAELVQAVKDGDITTHKQYQEALAEIRARDAKIEDLLEMSEAADRRAEEAERKQQEANKGYSSAMETLRQAQEDAANADARARAAEHDRDEARKERDGARDALQAAKLRGDRLKAENDDLKARPIEAAVVDEDEVNRRAEARAQEVLAAKLTEQREISARNAEDAIILLGRQINTAWQMVRPFLAEMDELQRVEAVDRINKEWAQTQKEIMSCL